MVFYVYICKCYVDRRFSCYWARQTKNLKRRQDEHNKNVINHDTSKFTGIFDYVKLFWYRKVNTRKYVLRLENYLKKLSPKKRAYIC